MTNASQHRVDLTKNQALVMSTLTDATEPLSAYSILHELRDHGLKAPLQVYRALDKLVELGMVHRLESLNAFVACQHDACSNNSHQTIVFTICQKCNHVKELGNASISDAVSKYVSDIGFSLDTSVIELRGTCTSCH